jgi:hypothetical protein
MRNAKTVLGIIHNRSAVLEDTGEPGAPNSASPVRGGAVGKVPATATR